MVFVPWNELGICKYHAMHKTTCFAGDRCQYRHAPEDETRIIWDWYTEKERLEKEAQTDSTAQAGTDNAAQHQPPLPLPLPLLPPPPPAVLHSGRAAPPAGHPVALAQGTNISFRRDSVPTELHPLPPRPAERSLPRAIANLDGAFDDREPSRGSFDDSQPGLDRLPPPVSYGSFELGRAPPPASYTSFESSRDIARPPSSYSGFDPDRAPLPPAMSPGTEGRRDYGFMGSHHGAPPAGLRREWSQWAPDVGDLPDDRRPSSSGYYSAPPPPSSDYSYPYSRGYSPSPAPGGYRSPPPLNAPRQHRPSSHEIPWQRPDYHAPAYRSPAYETPAYGPPDHRRPERRPSSGHGAPEINPKTNQEVGKRFDPAKSSNAFVNGSMIYRFVWGEPICVRCGTVGHLPKKCRREELSKAEQDYLYKLMRKEQNRSKAVQGVDKYQSTSNLAPSAAPARTPTMQEMKERQDAILAALSPPKPQAVEKQMEEQGAPMANVNNINPGRLAQMQRAEDGNAKGKKKREVGKQPDVKAVGRVAPGLDLDQQLQQQMSSPYSLPTTGQASVPLSLSALFAMGATKRLSNGEAKSVGPHPSTIRVSAPYITQAAVEKRLQPPGLDAQERSQAEAREDSVRLQGVTWLDNVRRALQLPIKTFTTACVYYHKFRLAHPTVEYAWQDAAAASLLTSCKNEDTLKKSRDILAAAYNLKQPTNHEQVGADDPIFEAPSRVVIGLERLVLESGGFDFRSRAPHQALIKIAKTLPESDDLKTVAQLAWTILTDLHRTFAPLKQTSSTLALASLELAAHFQATRSGNNTCTVRDNLQVFDIKKWYTTREEVMETLLDALDLYTHHTSLTILGTKYSLDDFLRIRLALNKECSESNLPRYTVVQPPPSPDNANGTGSTLRVANGHPTPVSPTEADTQAPPQQNIAASNQPPPEGGGTLRFMLDPMRATDERTQVNQYYTEEWEEYEEEIEVPLPRNSSRDRDPRDYPPDRPSRDRDGRPRDYDDRRGTRDDRDATRGPPGRDRQRDPERSREGLSEREREAERERARVRDRERERRYDDRRFEDRDRDRDRDRRYDDRRDRDRDRDRRYYDDDRRRGRDDRR